MRWLNCKKSNVRMHVHWRVIIYQDILCLDDDLVKGLGSTIYWYLQHSREYFMSLLKRKFMSSIWYNICSHGAVLQVDCFYCQMVFSLKSSWFPAPVCMNHLRMTLQSTFYLAKVFRMLVNSFESNYMEHLHISHCEENHL